MMPKNNIWGNILYEGLKIGLKYFFIYFFFGYVSLLALYLTAAWGIQLQEGVVFEEAISIIAQSDQLSIMRNNLFPFLPFDDVYENTFGNVDLLNGYGTVVKYVKTLAAKKDFNNLFYSFIATIVKLIPDITATMFASFLFTLIKTFFNRLRKDNLATTIALAFPSFVFFITSFSFSSTFFFWLEEIFPTETSKRYLVYFCILSFSLISKSLIEAFSETFSSYEKRNFSSVLEKTKLFPFIVYYLLDIFFGIVNSLVIFSFCYYCNTITSILFTIVLLVILQFFIRVSKRFLLSRSFPNEIPSSLVGKAAKTVVKDFIVGP